MTAVASDDAIAPPSPLREFWRHFRANRGAVLGLAVVSLVSQDMGVALVPEALKRSALKGAVFRPLQEAVAQSEAYGVWRSAPRSLLVERLLEEMPRALPPGH